MNKIKRGTAFLFGVTVLFLGGCGKTQGEVQKTHNYVLNEQETLYGCSDCGDIQISGKTTFVKNDTAFDGSEGFTGNIISKYDMNTKNYLFIGSSLANGYDSTSTKHVSMADMLRQDYLTVDFSVFEKGKMRTGNGAYFRKDQATQNGKAEGVYVHGKDVIQINNNGTGSLNGNAFEYYFAGNNLSLCKPTGNLFTFNATMRKADTVWKYTSDGNTMSAYGANDVTKLDPEHKYRYDGTGAVIGMTYSSDGYEGSKTKYQRTYVAQLEDAVYDLGNENIDTVFVQLSTNDMGQFVDENATTHLPFGKILEDGKRSPDDFDVSTSFGALEWMISTVKEQWKDAKIVFFTGWMYSDEWEKAKNDWANYVDFRSNFNNYEEMNAYAQMRMGLLQAVEKWDVDLIDLWADRGVNEILNSQDEDGNNYKCDVVHLKKSGYDKAIYPIFREYIDGTYEPYSTEKTVSKRLTSSTETEISVTSLSKVVIDGANRYQIFLDTDTENLKSDGVNKLRTNSSTIALSMEIDGKEFTYDTGKYVVSFGQNQGASNQIDILLKIESGNTQGTGATFYPTTYPGMARGVEHTVKLKKGTVIGEFVLSNDVYILINSTGSGGTLVKDPSVVAFSDCTVESGTFNYNGKTMANKDSEICVRPSTKDGMTVVSVAVETESGNTVTATKNADGTYSFTMPESSVSVKVNYKESEIYLICGEQKIKVETGKAIGDLPQGKWFVDGYEISERSNYVWDEDKTATCETNENVVEFIIDGVTVWKQPYGENGKNVSFPDIPVKQGYVATWESVEFDGGAKTVNAVYTKVTHTVTFKVDGKVVKTVDFDIDTKLISTPVIPVKDGYEIVGWDLEKFPTGDVVANAIYRKK